MSSRLDTLIKFTTFPDQFAFTRSQYCNSLRQIAALIERTNAPSKGDLPFIKLGLFGSELSTGRSYRCNANMLFASGVEGDHDTPPVPISAEAAAGVLRRYGIAGLIYTTPSNTPAAPRWRALVPFSDLMPAAQRDEWIAVLNGVFEGALADESHTRSQAYYFGGVGGVPVQCFLVDGGFIDQVEGLPAPIGRRLKTGGAGQHIDIPAGIETSAIGAYALAEACKLIVPGDGRHPAMLDATNRLAPFVLAELLSTEDVLAYIGAAMTAAGRDPRTREIEDALDGGLQYAHPYEAPTNGAEFDDQVAPEVEPEVAVALAGQAATVANDAWRSMLSLSEKDKILPLLRNARLFLIYDPAWQGVLQWNSFAEKAYFAKQPPWHVGSFEPRRVTDHDGRDAAVWLQGKGCMLQSKAAHEALIVAARANLVHPVREYLSAIKWDGTARIDSWLIDHLGAEDTPLNRAFARCWLIAGAARIFRPGCKVDTVLILEGAQGIRKSSALRTVARRADWFSDSMPDLAHKDAMIQLMGNWIIEFAELDTLSRSEASRAKAFMSRAFDDFRKPFGFDNDKYQRACLFAGTINPGGSGYLIDETGARRYWPVACGVGWDASRKVDLEALDAVADQLWAEAVASFRAGAAWWLDTALTERQQQAATMERHSTDAWQAVLEEYLADRVVVASRELLTRALNIPVDRQDMRAMKRVGAIMRLLDWDRCKVKIEGAPVQCYASPNLPRDASGRRMVTATDVLLIAGNRTDDLESLMK